MFIIKSAIEARDKLLGVIPQSLLSRGARSLVLASVLALASCEIETVNNDHVEQEPPFQDEDVLDEHNETEDIEAEDIQQLMVRPDLNCTNSSCHDSTPGSSKVNLATGSLQDFAERLVGQPSGNSNCKNELLIDPDNPKNSLLYKLVDSHSGDQCSSKMPLGNDGIPDEHLPIFESWIKDIIDAYSLVEEEPIIGELVPNNPLSVATKLKLILHGGALTDEEYERLAFNVNQLNTDGLKDVVREWLPTVEYGAKLEDFLGLALQQRTTEGSYNTQLMNLGSVGSVFRSGLDNMFVKTVKRIVDDNEDFRQIATTNKWEMTTANLIAIVFADMGFEFRGHHHHYYRLAHVAGDEVRNDWRTVTLRKARLAPEFDKASSFDINESDFINRMRSIPDGGALDLYGERVGFFTAPVFFDNWRTNFENGHRVTTNQAVIVALGKSFESGDLTEPTHLSELQGEISEHAEVGTDCYGCHKNLDVMSNVFKNHYGTFTHRPTSRNDIAEFSFQGEVSDMNSMNDFGRALVSHPRFPIAWVLKLCQWINSQECSDEDPEVHRLAKSFVNSGYKFNELLLEFVVSPLVTHTDSSLVNSFHSGSMVSIARRNHYCHAMKTRIQFIRSHRGMRELDVNRYDDICTAENVSSNIPSDTFARGVIPFIQAVEEDGLLSKTYDVFCKKTAHLVVGPHHQNTFRPRDSDIALNDLASSIMGLPPKTQAYADTRKALQSLYDVARKAPVCGSTSQLRSSVSSNDPSCGLALNDTDALRLVWANVCQSPYVTGVGL